MEISFSRINVPLLGHFWSRSTMIEKLSIKNAKILPLFRERATSRIIILKIIIYHHYGAILVPLNYGPRITKDSKL